MNIKIEATVAESAKAIITGSIKNGDTEIQLVSLTTMDPEGFNRDADNMVAKLLHMSGSELRAAPAEDTQSTSTDADADDGIADEESVTPPTTDAEETYMPDGTPSEESEAPSAEEAPDVTVTATIPESERAPAEEADDSTTKSAPEKKRKRKTGAAKLMDDADGTPATVYTGDEAIVLELLAPSSPFCQRLVASGVAGRPLGEVRQKFPGALRIVLSRELAPVNVLEAIKRLLD